MVPMLMPQVCHAPSWPVVPLPTSAAGCATRSQWASLRGTSCLPTALQEPSLWSWAPVVTSSPRMCRSRDIESTAPSTTSMTRNFASSLQVCLSYCERESIIKYTAWLVIIGKFRVDKCWVILDVELDWEAVSFVGKRKKLVVLQEKNFQLLEVNIRYTALLLMWCRGSDARLGQLHLLCDTWQRQLHGSTRCRRYTITAALMLATATINRQCNRITADSKRTLKIRV